MSQNTLAEYRKLYKVRHGIMCPLSDEQVADAMATATVGADVWPLSLAVLTEMEALVATDFPAVDQYKSNHGGTLAAPQDLALDNETGEGFDANFTMPTGGNPPYSIQLQIAPDETGEPGEYADHGAAQDDDTEIVVDGLEATTTYWARLKVTDNLGEEAFSNEESTDTTA